ncbi:MAG: hypothetical protein A3J07_02645 [Candidatus Doudnabacteria bacterium RIFCSPLOWO2_02_FULL_49_13]|uniref:Uncharacterized protein n=1 Tax=Candidatus Doudnabacteria bacterium RIFCSPHIGHO2_12_FULL_48_16 TaxID=1817838 RepID=A0A1F5PL39_9BACT|nr:MAG: hypothetical protein A3E29_02160 [Candidatus Doudnabacteria bacterium RIFCSPHIGHO2_12_FULL_48_16]OGE97614.1 MAG: hypothetical protein A2990_03215 [Candidatus Doudnabacteria bacterium RIFCSPLOWO2_01_FULL_49_40]OGF02969.1 MAG: hypothetical protein A3J07_02645 [Candidatus Doudnabacteria bacterium RIFCSPLOWO2_02_FULL_49_13]
MDIKRQFKKHAEQHIHSPAHALADELSNKFSDKRHFGFYLKLALTHDHGFLRRIAGEVLESKTTRKPGALFAYLLKKNRNPDESQGLNKDAENSPSPKSDPK